MNVYDFDKTIFDGDSTRKFFVYLIGKYPRLWRYFPMQAWFGLQFVLGCISKDEFKGKFYHFLRGVENIEEEVKNFWNGHKSGIFHWYKAQQREDDVIVSASPEFLLEEICRRLGIRYLIASKVDKKTGTLLSKNCYGKEKVPRFLKEFKAEDVECFYSDSLSDTPLAKLAQKSFLVKKETLILWNVQDIEGK